MDRFRFHGYLELLDDKNTGSTPSTEQVRKFADILLEKFQADDTKVWFNWNSGRIDIVGGHAAL